MAASSPQYLITLTNNNTVIKGTNISGIIVNSTYPHSSLTLTEDYRYAVHNQSVFMRSSGTEFSYVPFYSVELFERYYITNSNTRILVIGANSIPVSNTTNSILQ
jgi:hypothetical protein